MGHRRILTGEQIAQLFDPPTDRHGIIRHHTLSTADLAMIRRGRGDHHSLGTYLRVDQNRRRHSAALQDRLGLQPWGPRVAADLADCAPSRRLTQHAPGWFDLSVV